jgi:hypothetical protein
MDAGGPRVCNASTPCGDGFYCEASGCNVAGTCKARPAEVAALAPVCGCDGVTYWNASVANANGVTISQTGECSAIMPNLKRCGDLIACPNTGRVRCQREANTKATCVANLGGVCWGLPKTCPPTAGTMSKARDCGNDKCLGFCEAIDKQSPYYTPSQPCAL